MWQGRPGRARRFSELGPRCITCACCSWTRPRRATCWVQGLCIWPPGLGRGAGRAVGCLHLLQLDPAPAKDRTRAHHIRES